MGLEDRPSRSEGTGTAAQEGLETLQLIWTQQGQADGGERGGSRRCREQAAEADPCLDGDGREDDHQQQRCAEVRLDEGEPDRDPRDREGEQVAVPLGRVAEDVGEHQQQADLGELRGLEELAAHLQPATSSIGTAAARNDDRTQQEHGACVDHPAENYPDAHPQPGERHRDADAEEHGEELVLRLTRIADADEIEDAEGGEPGDAEPEQRISPAESAPAPPQGGVDVSVG